MSETKTPWYKGVIFLAILGAIISSLTTIIFDWVKGKDLFSTISEIFVAIGRIISSNIPLIYVLPIAVILVLISFYLYQKNKSLHNKIVLINPEKKLIGEIYGEISDLKIVKENPFRTGEVVNYKGYKINDLTWKWSWRKNPFTDEFEPYHAIPLCEAANCDYAEMVVNRDGIFRDFRCPKCNKIYEGIQNEAMTNTIIKNVVTRLVNNTKS